MALPSGASVTNSWNVSRSGNTFTNVAYNGSIAAGQSTEFGANMDVLDYRTGNIGSAAWSNNVDPDINRELRQNAAGDASFIDPLSFLCQGGLCSFKKDGVFRYSDFGHFSISGATEAVKLYFPIVRENAVGALPPSPSAKDERADLDISQ